MQRILSSSASWKRLNCMDRQLRRTCFRRQQQGKQHHPGPQLAQQFRSQIFSRTCSKSNQNHHNIFITDTYLRISHARNVFAHLETNNNSNNLWARRLSSPSFNSSHQINKSKKITKRSFIPEKAAVQLTPAVRVFLKSITTNSQKHVLLDLKMSQTGEPRMVFSFGFIQTESNDDENSYKLTERDEPISLELEVNGTTPKLPSQAFDDGLFKLIVGQNAFLKVLGATIALDTETGMPIVMDREGSNRLDPNA